MKYTLTKNEQGEWVILNEEGFYIDFFKPEEKELAEQVCKELNEAF